MEPHSDTSPEAQKMQLEIHRKLGTSGRGRIAMETSDSVRAMALVAIRRANPHYAQAECVRALVFELYGIRLDRP